MTSAGRCVLRGATKLALLMGGAGMSAAAGAAVLPPWVGAANYQLAPTATGDEDSGVGLFSGYDFSSGGVALLEPDVVATPGTFTVGDSYLGYYQSYVTAHVDQNGITVAAPQLNTTGAGGGYELTVAAWFKQVVTGVAFGSPQFDIVDGGAKLFFDTTPDFSFAGDSGFKNDAVVLEGSVVDGAGYLIPFFGIGGEGLTLSISNFQYDHNVYQPDTIGGANGDITLRINPNGVTSGVTSVAGHAVNAGTDFLWQADGNMDLLAVPVPAAVWLLGSGLMMLAPWRLRHGPFSSLV